MILDFTITTCLRPEILRRTLESFRANLRGVEWDKCSVFVNVDPVGDGTREEISSVLGVLECDKGIHFAAEPSFPLAVKWCFSKPAKEYCFHLEDDWELLEPIDIADMLSILQAEQREVVNLRAKNFSPQLTRCFLSPGLWRSEIMRTVAAAMDGNKNPEVQLWNVTDRLHVGRYWPRDQIVVKDIGREWLAASGYRKNVEVDRGVNPWTKWEAR